MGVLSKSDYNYSLFTPLVQSNLRMKTDTRQKLAVCSIRTYTPGICYCCQDETALDLREKFD